MQFQVYKRVPCEDGMGYTVSLRKDVLGKESSVKVSSTCQKRNLSESGALTVMGEKLLDISGFNEEYTRFKDDFLLVNGSVDECSKEVIIVDVSNEDYNCEVRYTCDDITRRGDEKKFMKVPNDMAVGLGDCFHRAKEKMVSLQIENMRKDKEMIKLKEKDFEPEEEGDKEETEEDTKMTDEEMLEQSDLA